MTLYTKTDIAEKLSTAYSRVTKTIKMLGLQGQYEGGRKDYLLYTKEQVEQIRQALRSEPVEVKAPVVAAVRSIEELKELHPLVTDERFLKDGFFPNVIPNCFEE